MTQAPSVGFRRNERAWRIAVPRIIRVNTVIAHHPILHGYAHWLSNDPRGSGSVETRKDDLDSLGSIHFGRKKRQPPKSELKRFYRGARDRLEFKPVWFNDDMRAVIGETVADISKRCGYTPWAWATCGNHAHGVFRVHRDPGHEMWERIAFATKDALRNAGFVPPDHPVWSSRPYVVFKTSVRAVYKAVEYVEDNPEKEGLPRQFYPWVQKYDGWPHAKRAR